MKEKNAPASGRLKLTRVFAATPEEVFDAWLDPDGVRQWLCPGALTVPIATIDARVGGSFRILMRGEDGDYDHHGTYREIRRPERLVFTWRSSGTMDRDTLVTIDLHALQDGRTELTLTHEQLPDATAVERHTGGWSAILEKLQARCA